MGNICRSPSAEGFLRHRLQHSRLAGRIGVDSAGTHSYHLGNPPDPRAVREAGRFGVDISGLRARKVREQDFADFDLMVAMDRDNLATLERLAPDAAPVRLELMMSWYPRSGLQDVPDPYYGTRKDFALMCELLDEATAGLLAELEESRA